MGPLTVLKYPWQHLELVTDCRFSPQPCLTIGWMSSYKWPAGLHSPLAIRMTCHLSLLMSVDRRMAFNDSVAAYGVQSIFAAGGAQEQVLNCHNPAPDANETQICYGKT